MDKPGGYEPSDARSIRAGDAVTVADMVMQRIVVPPYAGSNPASHLIIILYIAVSQSRGSAYFMP